MMQTDGQTYVLVYTQRKALRGGALPTAYLKPFHARSRARAERAARLWCARRTARAAQAQIPAGLFDTRERVYPAYFESLAPRSEIFGCPI